MGLAKADGIAAQAMGTKMAFITLLYREKKAAKRISVYGAQNLVIPYRPCRALTISLERFRDEYQVVNDFLQLNTETIHHGADVVISACCNYSTLFTYKDIADVEGMPIVHGAIAALKLVETMA